MNRELQSVCVFIASIMIFSSFTPFSYAMGEPKATPQNVAEFSTTRDTSQACSGDVWFDELNWSDYQRLRQQTANTIDGWGDAEAQIQDDQYAASGVPSNADALGTEHIFLPGAGNQPAKLYDVMEKKFVDTDTACHLDNLFSRGKISYATKLNDFLRYCPTEGSYPCERTATSADAERLMGVVDQLNATNIADHEAEISKFRDYAPDSVVESSDAGITLNADTNLFFWKTQADFINFVNKMAPVDAIIGATNFLGMGLSIGSLGKQLGAKLVGKVAGKAALKTLFEKQGITKIARLVEAETDLATNTKKLGTLLGEEITDAEKLLTTSGGKMVASPVAGRLGQNIRDIFAKAQGRLAGIKKAVMVPGVNNVDDLSKITVTEYGYINDFRKYGDMMNTQRGLKSVSDITELGSDGKNTLKGLLGANGRPVAAGATDGEIFDALKAFQDEFGKSAIQYQGGVYTLMADSQDALKATNSIQGLPSAEKAIEKARKVAKYEEIGIGQYSLGPSVLQRAASAVRAGSGYGEAARIFLGGLMTRNLGLIKYGYMATQMMQNLMMGALWLRNVVLVSPFIESQGVLELKLNNEISNFVLKTYGNPHYIDVKKTYGNVKIQKFLGSLLNRLFSAISYESEAKNAIQKKVKNIQDIVFILDQNALSSDFGDVKAANLIVNDSNGKWKFFSTFEDRTLIYNFEHPNGYTPKGKSALFLSLKNVNVYGVTGFPNEWFNEPVTDSVLPTLNAFRDAAGIFTLIGIIPGLAGTYSTVGGAILAIPVYFLGGFRITLERADDIFYGKIVDAEQTIKEEDLCTKKFDKGEKNELVALKAIRAGSAICSAATAPYFPTPLVLLGFACDGIQFGAEYTESKLLNRITNDLQSCYETDFEVLSFKDIPSPQELKTQTNDLLKPLMLDDLKIFNLLSSEIEQKFNSLIDDTLVQVMHLQVHAEDNPLTSTTGKELYYIHFGPDSDIKWFQGPKCNIDLCSKTSDGYKCMTQNGYWLLDKDGNPILDGIPQALSLKMNLEEGTASMVQRVINVKKSSGEMLEIYPDKTVASNNCLKDSLANLTGTKGLSAQTQERALNSLLGDLDAVYSPEGKIWFDVNNNVVVQFSEEKKCSNDVTFGAGEIFRFTNSHLNVYRDNEGKVEIMGNDGQTKCDLKLSDGAIGFSNGMIRSGFDQQPPNAKTTRTAGYASVYHIFIYSLVSANAEDVTRYSLKECEVEDGTKGLRPQIETGEADQEEQWNALFDEMCYVDVRGEKNSTATFNDSEVTVRDPEGLTKTYTIEGFDISCGNGAGGYVVVDQNGQRSCLFMETGPNGQPQIRVDDQAPIPLLWASGLGGAFMYDPSRGTISIKNEFPFALNPAFSVYGAMSGSLVTPGTPPHGWRETDTSATGTGSSNPLAALPWTPNGLELALFIIALAGGLLFVRIRFKKAKGT